VKLVSALAFVLVVVATPYRRVWVFGVYAVLLMSVAVASRVPLRLLARRMAVELPFVVFAVLLPFISRGERVEVLGVGLSVSGLWGAWSVLAKASLGVATSILLAATTDLRALIAGLDRLRMPTLLVQIMTLMIRYADVITDELRRMQIARASRGFVARDIRSLPVVAKSAGALFIRSYERGERVHLAMLSRGYDGSFPLAGPGAAPRQWITGMALPGAAALVAIAAWALG
jgi:cobalt/nickel transport system permease protein